MATESYLREKYLAGLSGLTLSQEGPKERFIWAFQHNLGNVPLDEFPAALREDVGPVLKRVLENGDPASVITGLNENELSDLAHNIVSFYGRLSAS